MVVTNGHTRLLHPTLGTHNTESRETYASALAIIVSSLHGLEIDFIITTKKVADDAVSSALLVHSNSVTKAVYT